MLNIKFKEEGTPARPEWVASQDGALWTLKLDDDLELVATDGCFAAQLRGRDRRVFLLHASEGHGDVAGAINAAEHWLLDWTHKLSNTIQIMRHYRASYAAQAGRAVEQACKNIDPITQGGALNHEASHHLRELQRADPVGAAGAEDDLGADRRRAGGGWQHRSAQGGRQGHRTRHQEGRRVQLSAPDQPLPDVSGREEVQEEEEVTLGGVIQLGATAAQGWPEVMCAACAAMAVIKIADLWSKR